jgi:isocitrate dehydrogenase (NAD+)
LNESEAARRIEKAVHAVYKEGKAITHDVGGSATTKDFADAVIQKMQK